MHNYADISWHMVKGRVSNFKYFQKVKLVMYVYNITHTHTQSLYTYVRTHFLSGVHLVDILVSKGF